MDEKKGREERLMWGDVGVCVCVCVSGVQAVGGGRDCVGTVVAVQGMEVEVSARSV